MSCLSFILLGAVCFILAPEAMALECSQMGLTSMTCPLPLVNDDDEIFCCETSAKGLHKCCDIEEFMKQNSGILAGIVIAAVVIFLIITLCCCCFCSCCCLAKRRVQRGHVLYGPVGGAQVVTTPIPNTFQVVHPPPATQAYSPPPYNPNYAASQPAVNPYYK
ncbi:uncharacterized protein [Parasteatoda tepidariorum]|uniref:uncharacterized protein isoform X2 n=1 Tax=Parasteatoda tepidariorum TaxID=114398 RepID=UPI00077FC3EA|nr:protein shisa-4 isoform X2 [Parasteatoda tepidariorum]XP_015920843.1 protein shisa-4 isoform X2 [Parasteatoda tepidariorum]